MSALTIKLGSCLPSNFIASAIILTIQNLLSLPPRPFSRTSKFFIEILKFYKEFIKSGTIFLDLPTNLIDLIASKLDLSLPTTTNPIIPMPLCGVHQ